MNQINLIYHNIEWNSAKIISFVSAFFLVLKRSNAQLLQKLIGLNPPKKHVFEFGRESLFLEADNCKQDLTIPISNSAIGSFSILFICPSAELTWHEFQIEALL